MVSSLTGCGDAPTAPGALDGARTPVPTVDPTQPVPTAPALALGEYACRLLRMPPGGERRVQTRPFDLDRRGLREAEEGRRVRYVYRRVGPDGRLNAVLKCVIPATRAAVSYLDDVLGVRSDFSGLPGSGDTGRVSTLGDCVEDGGVCDLGEIKNSGSGGSECDPYEELDFTCDDGGEECATDHAVGGIVVLAVCSTGSPSGGGDDGGGGPGDSTDNTVDDCPNCVGLSYEMRDAMTAAVMADVVDTSDPDCGHLQTMGYGSVIAGAWGQEPRTGSIQTMHHQAYHSDPDTYFHFSINTNFKGFPWVASGWSSSTRQIQLAGAMIHEMAHHYYAAATESYVDSVTSRCVPGYDENLY